MLIKKGTRTMYIVLILILSLTTLGFWGCRRKDKDPGEDPKVNEGKDKDTDIVTGTDGGDGPIDGGVTNKTDYFAPKEIVSKDITEYRVNFCLEGEWAPGHSNVFYTFEIKPDAAGKLTATESETGVAAAADKELLDALQKVIDDHKLVSMNGEYRLTAGIDPSLYGPRKLDVKYASGEVLSFTNDNDPYDEWAIKTYLAFAKWFADKGEAALLPEGYEGMVSDISILFNDTRAGRSYYYGIEAERDKYGRLVATRTVDGETGQAVIFSPLIFFDSISRVVSDFDLSKYAGAQADNADALMQIRIKFEDGHEININTSDESEIDELIMLPGDLFNEFDTLF